MGIELKHKSHSKAYAKLTKDHDMHFATKDKVFGKNLKI